MRLDIIKRPTGDMALLNLSKNEALEMIQSLSSQLRFNDPNVGRAEWHIICDGVDRVYFSAFVVNDEDAQ